MSTRGSRLIGIITLLLLAPLSAELLSAYLGDLGGPLNLIGFVLFLAPLYGGAGLLIREVCVRAGWGWSGRLLLGAAFGVAMVTLVDGSLFTPHRTDITGWEELQGAAAWLGVGWFAATIWVVGHLVMSVAAPLAVAEGLARRPGPWLGGIGIAVTAAGLVAVAVAINRDSIDDIDDIDDDATGLTLAVLAVIALIGLAASPLGRPLAPTRRWVPNAPTALVLGFVSVLAFDLALPGPGGLAYVLTITALACTALLRSAASPDWSPRLTAALACGALLARTLTGIVATLTTAEDRAAGLAQSAAYLVALVALTVAVERRTRDLRPGSAERATGGPAGP